MAPVIMPNGETARDLFRESADRHRDQNRLQPANDSARLWDTIHETAKFGATPKGGVRRLTLGPEDKQVRDWFRKACEAAGLEVHVDALGSMFGLRKGRDMSKPAGRPRLASRHPADRRQI